VSEPRVTVGLIPRERFSLGAEALRRVIEGADIPFRLIVVDCLTPVPYRLAQEEILQGLEDVQVERVERFLMPSESKSLVLRLSQTPYTCFVENDLLVEPGWLKRLVETMEETGADAIVPMLFEGRDHKPHFTRALGRIRFESRLDGSDLGIEALAGPEEIEGLTAPVTVQIAENHCVLYRTETAARAGVCDPRISTNEFIDDSLTLHAVGARMLLEPRVRATFIPPPAVNKDESAFFRFRWEKSASLTSHRVLMEKWRLSGMPDDLDERGLNAFLDARQHQESFLSWYLYVVRTRWRWPLGRVRNRLRSLLHVPGRTAARSSISNGRL
jgi:hypothetical protein